MLLFISTPIKSHLLLNVEEVREYSLNAGCRFPTILPIMGTHPCSWTIFFEDTSHLYWSA